MFNIPTVTVAKTTLDSTSDSVTLDYAAPNGVAWTPRHLVLRWNARSSEAMSGERVVSLNLNGDTGANYNDQLMSGAGSTVAAGRAGGATAWNNLAADTGDDAPANGFSSGEFLLPDALSTRSHKSVLSMSGAIEQRIRVAAGRWASTAAITSVTLTQAGSGEFMVGSTFELCVVDESFNIDEQILGSDGTFTVSSISAADGDLVCIGNLRSTRSSNTDLIKMAFNSDTTDANYNYQYFRGLDSAVLSGSGASRINGQVLAASEASNLFSPMLVQIPNYSDGSNDRLLTTWSGSNGAAAGNNAFYTYQHRWNNTAAVTSLDVTLNIGSYLTNSMLSTYAVPKNLIERQEMGADTTTITFSSIPQTYDHLELTMYARSDRAATVDFVDLEFNGDTTDTNYDMQRLWGTGSTVGAQALATIGQYSGTIPGTSIGANIFGQSTTTVYNYTKTDRHKHRLVVEANGMDGTSTQRVGLSSARWESTAAITSIVITSQNGADFVTGSVFELRGISADITALPSAGYTIFF